MCFRCNMKKRCLFCTFMWRNKGLLLKKFTLDIAWRWGNFKARSSSAKSKLTEKDDIYEYYSELIFERDTAWSICHWGEKDKEDDEIDQRYRPACNFSCLERCFMIGWYARYLLPYFYSSRPLFLKKRMHFRLVLNAPPFFSCSTSYLAVRGCGTFCWLQD